MILLWLIVLGGGFVFYWIQDANRLKPELEDLLETETGVKLRIGGDLAWRLWPPLSLVAHNVEADHQNQSWSIERLALDISVASLLRNPGQWVVQAISLSDAEMREDGDLLEVQSLTLQDFSPGVPAPVHSQIVYTPHGRAPVPLAMNGMLTFDPAGKRLIAEGTRFETDLAEGTCDLSLAARPTPSLRRPPATPAGATELVPLALIREHDWAGTCDLSRLVLRGEPFTDVSANLSGQGSRAAIQLGFPRFLGGTADFRLNIDANNDPVLWTLKPDLTNVDSKRLLVWLGRPMQWLAPLAYGGTLRAEGSTEAALIATLSGETRLEGGQGSIDIAGVKQQILAVATLLQAGERIRRWPDVWEYQRLVGDWRIQRQHHLLDFKLDNLTVIAEGDYLPDPEEVDFAAELTFSNDPAFPVFDVDPLLFGLPIPVRCQGSVGNPTCRVDQQAAQRVVASALQNDEPTGLRGKLERKIEDEVPPEYQEAARSLLDIFSRSMQAKPGDN